MSSSLINNNNNNAKRNYVNEKKQINTAEFSKTVMQSALAHLLKSCEKDGEKEGDERKKINSVEYGALAAFSDIIGKTCHQVAAGPAVAYLVRILSRGTSRPTPARGD